MCLAGERKQRCLVAAGLLVKCLAKGVLCLSWLLMTAVGECAACVIAAQFFTFCLFEIDFDALLNPFQRAVRVN